MTELANIHQISDLGEISFLPRHHQGFGERPETLDLAMSEDRIRDALEAAWPLPTLNQPTLLHGDYWPGNLLWRDGALAAVIDWEDASTGDPLADLGNTRLEFLWALGEDAMNEFTRRYLDNVDVDATHLPYWDLCAALRSCSKISTWGLDEATERRMRERHHWFVMQALSALPVRC
jgi:aminoglycoside phosphotransferase (APT) family kinase protein